MSVMALFAIYFSISWMMDSSLASTIEDSIEDTTIVSPSTSSSAVLSPSPSPSSASFTTLSNIPTTKSSSSLPSSPVQTSTATTNNDTDSASTVSLNFTSSIFSNSTSYPNTTSIIYASTTTNQASTSTVSLTSLQLSTVQATVQSAVQQVPTNLAAVVVPAVIVPVVVVGILAAVILLKRRQIGNLAAKCTRRNRRTHTQTSSERSSFVLPEQTSIVVPAGEFLAYLKEMEKESDFKYAEQFESLQLVGREQSTDHATLKCNVDKNRYLNIHPYDITRVKLLPTENEDGSDYINASWIPGYYSKREYIAAQGPLPGTEDDMWRMIWEYNCKGIIMLTKCMELGRKKCDQYWPDDTEPVIYGDIQVTIVDETTLEDQWSFKKLEISMGQHKRFIKLCHFICWPDSSVPPGVELLLTFMDNVRNEIESTRNGPLVVHCSAGVGRTGTYIAVETLLQQLENEGQIDIFGVVYRLRMNRVFMVQTERQFKFIHEVVGHIIENKYEHNSKSLPLDENDVTIIDDGGKLIPVEESQVNGVDNRAFTPTSQI